MLRAPTIPSLALAACLAAPAAAARQPTATPPGQRPESAQRIVRAFDFEERDINPDPVPRYWSRAQSDPAGETRPGFPTFNAAALDYSPGAIGEGAVRLPTFGGSTSLLLDPGVIAVFPDVDYEVRAMVRTDGLTHARAALLARFLDAAGAPIAASARRSELVRSPDGWTPIRVEMLGAHHAAAFLQLELLLLQPEHFAPRAHGAFQVWPSDVAGSARFDDLTVLQLPRIELTAPAPGAVWSLPDRPRLVADIRDLTGESLTVSIDVTDARGAVVARHSRPVGVGRARVEWTPDLPALGWYAARMVVSNDHAAVGAALAPFAWLGPDAAVPDDPARRRAFDAARRERRRFGVVIDTLPPEVAAALAPLLDATGAGAVWMPLWDAAVTQADAVDRAKDLAPLVAAAAWRQVTLTIPTLPHALAEALSTSHANVWALADAAPGSARNALVDPFVDRLGQRVERWQIGPLAPTPLALGRALDHDLERLRSSLLKLVTGATLVIPWHAEHSPPAAWTTPSSTAPRAMTVLVPWQLPEAALGELVSVWSVGRADRLAHAQVTFVLEPPPALQFSPHTIGAQIVRRAVEVRALSDLEGAPVDSAIPAPWRSIGDRRPAVVPQPELAAWRNLGDRFAGRVVAGRLPIAPGIVCYVLAPAPGAPPSIGGALVAWNRSADPDHSVLRLALGTDSAHVVDLFGNRAPVPMRAQTAITAAGAAPRAVSEIPLTDAPVFIEGIDVDLVRFVASFRLDPPILETTSRLREHRLLFDNPWPTTLSGRHVIVEPGGFDPESRQRDRTWRITPRAAPFQVPAGQPASLPITVAYGAADEAGPRDFVIDFEIAAGRAYEPVRVWTRVDVGLDSMQLDLRALATADALVVEASVANTGSDPLDAELTAFAPDRPRAKASVAGLLPGSSASRNFRFADPKALRGHRLVVVLTDPRSGGRLMRTIVIE